MLGVEVARPPAEWGRDKVVLNLEMGPTPLRCLPVSTVQDGPQTPEGGPRAAKLGNKPVFVPAGQTGQG